MLTDKEKDELEKLIELGKKQNFHLNAMLVYNYFVGLSSERQNGEIYSAVVGYLRDAGIELIDDDIEMDEAENGQLMANVRPFDPSRIDIDMKTMELSSIIKRIRYEEVNLKTHFQRKGGLWSDKQKSQLIESLLLRIPIPAFYFDGGVADNWLIIDGLQRITALKEFVVDEKLKLTGLEFFTDLEGAKFSDLPRSFKRRIEESNVVAFIVKGSTPVNVKYNIFKRINTGGLELTPQEIRHALYYGKATDICKRLAECSEFKKATSNSIRTERMMDQEFVLRFTAVCYYGIGHYDGIPDNFLNDAMGYLGSAEGIDVEGIERDFKRVMNIMYELLGKYAFRRLGRDDFRRPINKAIYETWCYAIYHLSQEDVELLIKERVYLKRAFVNLCEDDVFLAMIKASDKKSYGLRFQMVRRLIMGVLDAAKDKS